jgi:hypothetical protein
MIPSQAAKVENHLSAENDIQPYSSIAVFMDSGGEQEFLPYSPSRDTEFLLQMQLRRSAELKHLEGDLFLLKEMFSDLDRMVGLQQAPLDAAETHVENAQAHVAVAEENIQEAKVYQTQSNRLRLAMSALVGTMAGCGAGGMGFALGLKPAAGLFLGGGVGLACAGALGIWALARR